MTIDAYIAAKQKGWSDDSLSAAARTRCLGVADLPAPCLDAMRFSETLGRLSADNAEFTSMNTAYTEVSTLCRLKLLKAI